MLQLNPQVLFAHAGWPLGTPGQAAPQLPQLDGSLVVSTHWPLHAVVPLGQLDLHTLPTQYSLAPHALPQAPQFCASFVRSAQP